MAHPCFGAEGRKLATNWLLFQGSAFFCSFCQNPHKFGKAVKLLTILVHAFSAVSAQREPGSTAGWKVKIHIPIFLGVFRGWQTLVLGSLHLCGFFLLLLFFFPEQPWGLPRSECRCEEWRGKVWKGGGLGRWEKRNKESVRTWQRAEGLDCGQKDERWGQEKRLGCEHRFEGVRADWGVE